MCDKNKRRERRSTTCEFGIFTIFFFFLQRKCNLYDERWYAAQNIHTIKDRIQKKIIVEWKICDGEKIMRQT